MTRAHAAAAAFGLSDVWTLATYLLEARVGTFLRPDPTRLRRAATAESEGLQSVSDDERRTA